MPKTDLHKISNKSIIHLNHKLIGQISTSVTGEVISEVLNPLNPNPVPINLGQNVLQLEHGG